MKLELINSSNDYQSIYNILDGVSNNESAVQNLLKFSQDCARVCYTSKDFGELGSESYREEFVQGLLKSGHHSVFEHINFTFNMMDLPKILAMVLNNEKQYATSEKSARYTKMKNMQPLQKEKFDKWMGLLTREIEVVYPNIKGDRETAIKKLAQENARYMTSVFTPTKMVYTTNWRQLNFIMEEFEKSQSVVPNVGSVFSEKLIPYMQSFLEQLKPLRVEGLNNQTDRKLSLFNKRNVEEHFGDSYSTFYTMSFAGLAQAHRHRTINYDISKGTELGAPLGFFIPDIIKDKDKLVHEWVSDLDKIAETDFPQAQRVSVNEKGTIEDFRSKALLRMCGHAQYEIMQQTTKTAEKYTQYQTEHENSINPKCLQGIACNSKCNWRGKRALERKV
jgi:hypothetical protein